MHTKISPNVSVQCLYYWSKISFPDGSQKTCKFILRKSIIGQDIGLLTLKRKFSGCKVGGIKRFLRKNLKYNSKKIEWKLSGEQTITVCIWRHSCVFGGENTWNCRSTASLAWHMGENQSSIHRNKDEVSFHKEKDSLFYRNKWSRLLYCLRSYFFLLSHLEIYSIFKGFWVWTTWKKRSITQPRITLI